MNRRVGVINRKRKKRFKEITDIEMTSRGEKLGYNRGEFGMGKADEIALQPMKPFTPKMTNFDIKMKFRNILKESQSSYWNAREVLLRENYIKSLEHNFNPKSVEMIIKKIKDMDLKEFRKIFEAEGGKAMFEFSYPQNQSQLEGNLEYLRITWLDDEDE